MPGNLHEHGSLPAEGGPRRIPGEARQPGDAGQRVVRLRGVAAAGRDPGSARAQHGPVRQQRPRPARLDQRRRFDAGAESPDQRGGPGEVGPQHQHVARVRVRRPRLVMDVVTVVPDGDQPEARDRGEHRRPGAEDHPHPSAGHGKKAAVPLGRPEVGRQGHEAPRADGGVEG